MITHKDPRIGKRSEQAFIGKEAETKAIEDWLRTVDRPLSLEKKEANSTKLSN